MLRHQSTVTLSQDGRTALFNLLAKTLGTPFHKYPLVLREDRSLRRCKEIGQTIFGTNAFNKLPCAKQPENRFPDTFSRSRLASGLIFRAPSRLRLALELAYPWFCAPRRAAHSLRGNLKRERISETCRHLPDDWGPRRSRASFASGAFGACFKAMANSSWPFF